MILIYGPYIKFKERAHLLQTSKEKMQNATEFRFLWDKYLLQKPEMKKVSCFRD